MTGIRVFGQYIWNDGQVGRPMLLGSACVVASITVWLEARGSGVIIVSRRKAYTWSVRHVYSYIRTHMHDPNKSPRSRSSPHLNNNNRASTTHISGLQCRSFCSDVLLLLIRILLRALREHGQGTSHSSGSRQSI